MGEFVEDREADVCEIRGCDRPAAVRLDVPWEGLCDVCPAHGRVRAQKEGVVALPIEQAGEEWSGGSGVEDNGEDGTDGDEDGGDRDGSGTEERGSVGN